MEPNSPKNIAIIGAGFGGMAAAYDLRRLGHAVTIFEAGEKPGGLAPALKSRIGTGRWKSSTTTGLPPIAICWGLIGELGWSDQVIFPRPYTVMYYQGKFYPFNSIPAAILFPGLGWGLNKLRFGLVGLYLRLTNNWRALEKYTVDEWMRKWAGDAVYSLMWEPLMIGKFGERYAKKVNMAWMWARLKARTTRLGTFEGGFQAFVDQFYARLVEMGVEFQLNTPVSCISPHSEGGLTLGNRHQRPLFRPVPGDYLACPAGSPGA